jgi:zinc transport system ATP-binding protein
MDNAVLTVHDLTVALDNTQVLKNVSFAMREGETVAIIGPNGAGKTVLLKTLLGLYSPDHGTVNWASNAKIAYVPQKIDADRHLPLHAGDLLKAKARILKFPQRSVSDAVHAVGITQKVLSTPVGHLSGGQFQKMLIAFALLGDPKIILFDEPTASLDELSEEHIYELMHQLQDERGITFILVSHDLSVIYRYANRVLCLNKEKICYGTPEEALTPEMLEKLYAAPHKFFHHLTDHHA